MKKRIFLAIGLLTCLSFLAQAQTWDSAKRLTYTTGESNKQAIAAYSVHVHAIWSDDVSGIDELYYKKSADLGATWSTPTRLTWGGAIPLSPRIGVNGSTVHVVYEEDGEVVYRQSTDNGASWSRAQITWGMDVANIEMAVNGVTVHLAITGLASGTPTIFYKRSTDSGVTWGAPVNLGTVGGYFLRVYFTSISASGSNVHVVYTNDTLHMGHTDLYYRRSTDSGVNWSAPLQLARLESARLSTSDDSPHLALAASAASSGANVHIFFSAISSVYPVPVSDLYCKTSTNNGVTWGTTQRVTYGGQVVILHSKASAADGSNVYVTYQNNAMDDLYFKSSTDTGATWSAPTRLTYFGSPGEMMANASMVYSPGTGYFHIILGVNVDLVYGDEVYYKRGH